MDRLEPVLKQKFWILLVLGLILTISGWWMATSAIAKSISERTSAVEASFKSIPTGQIPNESWAKKLGAINTDQSNAIESTKLSMWKRQRDRMTWPDGISDPGYWGKFSNPMRELFRDSYEDEVRRVWKTVNPFNKNDGSGIVEYPLGKVFMLLKQKPWDAAPPDSEVMWTVREDLWLLECLLQTITSVNGGYDVSRGDACIHEIDQLELRGGGDKLREPAGGGGGGAQEGMGPGGMGGGMPGMGGAMGGGPIGMRGGAGGGPGGIAEGLKFVSVEFDPAEEFGDDGSSSSSGGASRGGPGFGAMGAMGGMNGGGSNASTPATEIKRYLQTDSQLPFKKRGFYLSVKMDHTKIPQLLAELTSNEKSVWPIEILRVQMSRLNEDDSTGGRSGVRGGGAQPPAGLPMGIPMAGASGQEQENLNPFSEFAGAGRNSGPSESSNSKHAQAMRAAFEDTLKDPVMAQVTICGAITIFKEVKEEEKKPVPVVAPVTDEPEATSPSAAMPGEAETSTAEPVNETAMETSEPAEMTAETDEPSESADKPEGEEKPGTDEPKMETGEN